MTTITNIQSTLEEFKKALQEEIKEIEKKQQPTILLKNGCRIESMSGTFLYRFQSDNLTAIPADTPCNLILSDNKKYSVTVAGVDEDDNEITLSSLTELPEPLNIAHLENGAKILLERLNSRIDEKKNVENPAGLRMLTQTAPNAFSNICPAPVIPQSNTTENQKKAILSALTNDITYIWGPPGTGKTKVIGEIIEALYKTNRSVLIVSHTNIAVDGAIEKVQHLNEKNANIPVLRLGIPQKDLRPDVTLDYHVKQLGKELYEKKEKLESQQADKNSEVSRISAILAKLNWAAECDIEETEKELQKMDTFKDQYTRAQSQYNDAVNKYKQFKSENPDIEKIKPLTEQKEQLQTYIINSRSSIEKLDLNVQKASRILTECANERAKHLAYEKLTKELAEYEDENSYIQKIAVIEKENSQLNEENSQLQNRIETLNNYILEQERILEQKQKNRLVKFFSKKKIASIEADISQCESEISQAKDRISQNEDQIEVNSRVRDDYKELKIKVRSLKKHRDDSTPHLSVKELEIAEIEASQSLISNKQIIDELNQKINGFTSEIESINQQISILHGNYNEFQRLKTLTIEAECELTSSKERCDHHHTLCRETIHNYITASLSFCGTVFENVQTLREKFEKIKILYQQVKEESSGWNIESLKTALSDAKIGLKEINDALDAVQKKIENLGYQTIVSAKIIGATLAKTYFDNTIQERKFDTVILDEASMASIPALWCAAYTAGRNIVIVGDFLQLKPIVQSNEKMAQKWLGRNIFEVSGIEKSAKKNHTKAGNFFMLNDQFRMEKDIADIANLYYGDYGGLHSDDLNQNKIAEREKFYSWYNGKATEHPVELIDTSWLEAWVTGAKSSKLNWISAAFDVDFAFLMLSREIQSLKNGGTPPSSPKILIIAHYKAHAEYIKALINSGYQRRGLPADTNLIKAGTIHSFQGNEADIVIFDLVLDHPHTGAMIFMPGVDDELRRMFNVSVTRAKFKLFIVGNIGYCQKHAKENELIRLLHHLQDEKNFSVIDARRILPNFVDTPSDINIRKKSANHHIICNENTFWDVFREDIKCFSRQLVVYSPYISDKRLSQIIPLFADVIREGRKIIVITKTLSERPKGEVIQYKEREKALTQIGVHILHKFGTHEKLIFVDDSAVWMGSLNALSFTGQTGEIMHRHNDPAIIAKYQDYNHIAKIVGDAEEKKNICTACGVEMTLHDKERGVYWKCRKCGYKSGLL